MMPHSNGWLAEGVCGHFMGGLSTPGTGRVVLRVMHHGDLSMGLEDAR